jgi:hypothetical protein
VNGFVFAAIREFRDDSVRDAEKLERMTSFPVFASIPEIIVNAAIIKKKRKRLAVTIGCFTFLALVVAVFYYFQIDLNTFLSR